MSLADPSVPLANLSRRAPFTVRFSPHFVNRMWDRLQKSVPARANVAGLLFGSSEPDLSEIQIFRSFPEPEGNGDLVPDSALVEALIASSRNDPEVATLKLLGWYAFRPTGGLHENDVAFHNRHFPELSEIALILRPEQHPNVLFEIYSKSGSALLSEEEHRWGSLRLATDANVAGPVDVAMRSKIGDDFYLRAYQVSKNLDRAERREHWASAVEATKSTMRSMFRQKRKETYTRAAALSITQAPPSQGEKLLPAAQAQPAPAPPPLARAAAVGTSDLTFTSLPALQRVSSPDSASLPSFNKPRQDRSLSTAREATSVQTVRAGDPPALPAVVRPPRAASVPWLSSVLIAAVAAGATFGLFYHQQFSNGGMPNFLRVIFPETGLGLRVEGQGDRVLLSWNRHNAFVKASQGGILHIDDGAQHRDVRLDPAQVANGSVLYRPASGDVTFRLEVHGDSGAVVVDTMRVLDGEKATPLEAKSTPPDLSAADPTAPSAIAAPSSPTVVATPANRALRSAAIKPTSTARQATTPPSPVDQATTENRLTRTPAASPTPSEPASSTPLEPTQAAAPAPVTPSETRPLSAAPQPSAETPKPSTPTPSTDTARPPDTSKVSGWEDSLAGRTAEANSPHPEPAVTSPLTDNAAATFVPPKPRKQVLPDLRSAGIATIGSPSQVEVTVKVNKKGHVTEAYLVGNASQIPPYLAHAALAAAKQWTFEPATLRGKTVPSDHTIVFEFRPAAR